MCWKCEEERKQHTLKRDPIDENLDDLFEDLVVSSGTGGNNPDTNEHLDELSKS